VPLIAEERRPWLEQHRSGGRHRLLVAVEGSRIVGWATTSPFRPRAAYATTVESSVYCAPEHLGRGIGSRLYRALFEAIAQEDIERIVAGITLPNPASLRLHRRFGFRRVGTFHRVGRKFDRYWDVAWFERSLRSGAGPDSRAERAV
jgi:phosphinothricin acetyltransferase